MGNKTKPTEQNVDDFLAAIEPESRQREARSICQIMERLSGFSPQIWGGSMVGFGSYHYCYASGREGTWFRLGFAPRKNNFSLYIMSGFSQFDSLLSQLGKYKTGKSCLYINTLEDVDLSVLERLIQLSLNYMAETYPE